MRFSKIKKREDKKPYKGIIASTQPTPALNIQCFHDYGSKMALKNSLQNTKLDMKNGKLSVR
jgi:hypothetical protein